MRGLTGHGEAIVDTPDGPVLAPFALPGERVRVTRDRKAGGRWHGRIEEVIEPAADRVEPDCPLHARCGGCPLMTMSQAAQRAHKRSLVQHAVDRAGAGPVEVAWVDAGVPLGYRRRARMSFARGRGGARIGYHPFRSRSLLDVDRCPVLAPELQHALEEVRQRWLPVLTGRGEIRIGFGRDGRPVAWMRSEAPQPEAVYGAARFLVERADFAGIALELGGATVPACFGDAREHAVGWDGEPLIGPVGGFSQANEPVNRELVALVHRWAAPEGARILELFCGHGNLTVALARGAAQVTAVEADGAAAEACRENLARRGLEGTVRQAGAAGASVGPPVDVVVLDPPREGAAEAIGGIVDRHPARIVYVSCEPSTLGRDLQALARGGYAVRDAVAFDMFPQTAHVEAAALVTPA